MTLEDYRIAHRMTYQQLAEEISLSGGRVTAQALWRYATGLQFPSPKMLLRIRQVTCGAVTADSMVNQYVCQQAAMEDGR